MLTINTINTNIHLNPSLVPFGNRSELALEPGKYICKIHAKQGNLIFHHFSYDIYNGTWTEQPEQNEPSSLVIHEGETMDIPFTCNEQFGHPDDICIVNDSLLHSAEFTCECIPFLQNQSAAVSVDCTTKSGRYSQSAFAACS